MKNGKIIFILLLLIVAVTEPIIGGEISNEATSVDADVYDRIGKSVRKIKVEFEKGIVKDVWFQIRGSQSPVLYILPSDKNKEYAVIVARNGNIVKRAINPKIDGYSVAGIVPICMIGDKYTIVAE